MVIHTEYRVHRGLFPLPFTFHRWALIIRVNEVKRERKEVGGRKLAEESSLVGGRKWGVGSRVQCPGFQEEELGCVY